MPRLSRLLVLPTLVAGLLVGAPSSSPSVPLHENTDTYPRVGLAYGETLTWATPASLAAALDDAVRLNASWVRVDLAWNTIQPTGPETFHWAAFDRIVAAAHERGLNVLPILSYTPAWARSAGCRRFTCPPRDPRLFARYAARAAERYAPRGVHTWEIWNEENVPAFWVDPDPLAYSRLLRLASAAIKRTEGDARVVMGGLAAVDTGRGAMDPRQFLAAVCATGACARVDAVGYHPYTFPYLASDSRAFGTAWNRIADTRVSLLSVLRDAGEGGMRIWLTEYGAPTGGPGTVVDDATAVTPTTDHVSMRLQARIADDALRTAFRTPNVSALFWYSDRDTGAVSSNVDFYGLRRADGTRKGAWGRFAAGAGQLVRGR